MTAPSSGTGSSDESRRSSDRVAKIKMRKDNPNNTESEREARLERNRNRSLFS
ncbi:hypothetical protein OROMI_017659 [Orobanche minor]